MIDFLNMEEKEIPAFKGGDGVIRSKMFTESGIKIMQNTLAPGCSVGCHTHEADCEVIYILDGRARIILDDTEEFLSPGQCHYCPKGHTHEIHNAETDADLVFFAAVPAQQ